MLFACLKSFQKIFARNSPQTISIKQNFLSEINRTLPKILFSWTRACVRERMPIGQFLHEAVVTIKGTSTISASFFIDLLGVATIGHYRNFAK